MFKVSPLCKRAMEVVLLNHILKRLVNSMVGSRMCSTKLIVRSNSILRKTIEGYGFCFDFIAKGIIFSTQIINRYMAEPSLCKDSIKFSRCLEALLADLQK